jgi:hypothetical protein
MNDAKTRSEALADILKSIKQKTGRRTHAQINNEITMNTTMRTQKIEVDDAKQAVTQKPMLRADSQDDFAR